MTPLRFKSTGSVWFEHDGDDGADATREPDNLLSSFYYKTGRWPVGEKWIQGGLQGRLTEGGSQAEWQV